MPPLCIDHLIVRDTGRSCKDTHHLTGKVEQLGPGSAQNWPIVDDIPTDILVAIGIPGGVLDEPHELTPEADDESVGVEANVEIAAPPVKVQTEPAIALLLEVVGQKPRDLASLEPSHEPINLGVGEVIAPLDEANRPVPNPMRVPHPSANYPAHAHS